MKRKKIALILVVILCVGCIFATNITALAKGAYELTGTTNALDDLMRDKDFNPYDWPAEVTYDLEVITVAESTAGELYVYVYQPNIHVDHLARNIKIKDVTVTNKIVYKEYELIYCNTGGRVFHKYLVKGLFNLQDVREYEIISISRDYIDGVDESSDLNVIDEIAFKVGGIWTFSSKGLLYNDIEVIEIKNQHVGFVEYPIADQLPFIQPSEKVQSHYIAFSVDESHTIDELLEVDVMYSYSRWKFDYIHDFTTGQIHTSQQGISGASNILVTCKRDEIVDSYSYGQAKYGWPRIQTYTEFINEVEGKYNVYNGALVNLTFASGIKNNVASVVADMQWFIRFHETIYSEYESIVLQTTTIERTYVTEVSLMRLMFKSDGEIYNLGVVSNKQTGNGTGDNEIQDVYIDLKIEAAMAEILSTVFSIMCFIGIAVLILETLKTIFRK